MIKKPSLIISCPASSRSGYGDHARDIVHSIIKTNKYDVQILDQKWGNCPKTELSKYPELAKMCITQITKQPDVWIQVTVPNEFQKIGKYNIGITAGIETDRCAHTWLQGCNNMDLIIVPSKFSKQVFENTKYTGKNPDGSETELKLNVPVEVVLEGLDTSVFHKTKEKNSTVESLMANESDFCFLFVGHWLSGEFGHDRKDIATLIRTFSSTFNKKSKKNQPTLLLKTGMAGFSKVDEHSIRKRVLQLTGTDGPKVKLIHGDLTPEELNALYNHPKIKAMVSFTKGEGYGRPLLEFGITGKPIIATNWSGHVDFLKHATLLPGEVKEVHPTAQIENMIIAGSKWFYVDANMASSYLKSMHKDYKVFLENSRKQPQHIKDNFTLECADKLYADIFTKYIPDMPSAVEFKAPEISLPKLEKI